MANNEDDIDIGITVRDNGGGAVVDAMRAKLASYRAELKNLSDFEAEFGGTSGAGLASSLQVIDGEVNDVVAAFTKMARAIDITDEAAVKAYRAESQALVAYIEEIDGAQVAINQLGLALVDLAQKQRQAGSAASAGGGAVPAATLSEAAPALAASAQSTAVVDAEVQKLATDVNVAIGAFVRMGQLVDTTSREAVLAFRAEGDALASNLVSMGATDAELNRIGSTIGRVEQQFGAYTAAVATNSVEVERMPLGARRGANAIATLTFGLAAGSTSARTMAISLGSMISAMAAFSDSARVAAAATGIGALVTVLSVVIGLFYDLNHETDKAKDTLGDLGSLSAKQLKILHETNEANLALAQNQAAAAARQVEAEAQSLNPIENVIAAFHTKRARDTQKHYEDLVKLRENLTKSMVEAETKEAKALEEEGRKSQEKANQLSADRLRGPLAARRLAADQELADSLRTLEKETGAEKDKDAAAEGYRRQHAERILALDREEADHRRQLFERLQNDRLTAEAKLEDDTFQVQRASAERKYAAELESIKKDRDLNDAQRVQAGKLAEQAYTASLLDIEKERADRIREIREEAQGKLDAISGSDVNEAKIRAGYKKQIDVLNAAIASTATTDAEKAAARSGLALINALIPEEIAKARLEQIDKDISKTLSSEEQEITRTNALLQAHAITDQQAREKILDAMIKQRDTVAASIPLLQAQADLIPGNEEAIAKVEALKTKLLELNLSIMQVSDEFYKLKEAGIEASQNAIAALLEKIPSELLNQSTAQNNINAIRVHLASAQAELNDLMKGPQNVATTQRMTQLRAEIQGVNIDLGNAKKELVTWQSLFLDAARSIISALFQVEARMFAVYLVQQSLRLFGGGGGSGAGSALQIAGDVAGGVFAAGGGLIRGPGSSTSDSIPARLSDGEYVVRAAAVRSLGVGFLDAVNSAGSMPTAGGRSRAGGYAAGGLVAASEAQGAPSFHHLTVGMEDGLVTRHLESSEGNRVLLKWAENNSSKLRSLLGGR